MNADQLFQALAALPGARSVATSNGLGESRLVGGVEVAHAPEIEDGPLRKAWKSRTKGGPVPLLLLGDDPDAEGSLRALGPLSGGDPIRRVGAADLLRVLERLPQLSRLAAVRELAEELVRLDQGGAAGLVVRGLGTEHLLTSRLPASQRWPELSEVALPLGRDWRGVLEGLGYELERRKRRGYLLRHEKRPAAVVWPVADAAAFSRLDAEGRPPEGALVNDCIEENVRYGLLATSGRLRLFDAQPHAGSATGNYLELDAETLPEGSRPLLGLLGPDYLAEGRFDELMHEARIFGSALRGRLDQAIRQHVLPILGSELGRWARGEGWDLGDEEALERLEDAALTLVFRLLFLLYTESAGHLPVAHEAYRHHSLTQIVADAREQADALGTRSTSLWNRVRLLVDAMRTGDPALHVPAYNGALFAADGFAGADVLEQAKITDAAFGRALVALGTDPDDDSGVDFSGLAIGHLGNIYEGLLSLRLSLADRHYGYDARGDRYVPAPKSEADVLEGDLLWLTNEGGRKGGGVYYTPELLVRHLVRRAVVPTFEQHLQAVASEIPNDPALAAERLFAFRVLDPACGSAHFLVAVVDELADRLARFLAQHPLPHVQAQLDELRAGAGASYGVGVEDAALLRRLVLKRSIYGVDLSEMGAEIAKVSLWLASFVPGLALSYIDHNVRVGNALIGVSDLDQVRDPREAAGQVSLIAQRVRDAVGRGAKAAAELLELPDRTPDEVQASADAQACAEQQMAGARRLLDLWVSEPLGLASAQRELWERWDEIEAGAASRLADEASAVAAEARAFHWPLEFPEVYAARGGFDCVVGNPPWEEVTVEELAFYARYLPGLRGLSAGARDKELEKLKTRRPELAGSFETEVEEAAWLRAYFAADTGYEGGPGDPDLYKFFSQRYRTLLRTGGTLGVVLPRTAFLAQGSAGFRRWLFDSSRVERVDFLLNQKRWMFDTHPQYTVALLVAAASPPATHFSVEVAGVAASESQFIQQSEGAGLLIGRDALGTALEVPLLSSQPAADLLAKLRSAGTPFAFGTGRWRCFPVAELHETNDRKLWASGRGDYELWKGESFDQFDPHGSEARPCPRSPALLKKVRKPRPGSGSLIAADVPVKERAAAVAAEVDGPGRVAFRDVTNRTNSRTVIAALVPSGVFLTNKAPYLAFPSGSARDRAACLALMNSLVFDWQARRFAETNMNFFVLELLVLPQLDDTPYDAIAGAAARLSCPDERFAEFAAAAGVDCGPLSDDEWTTHGIEIDAHVARAWGLTRDELELVLEDFTLDAVDADYRAGLLERFDELARSSQ